MYRPTPLEVNLRRQELLRDAEHARRAHRVRRTESPAAGLRRALGLRSERP